MLWGDRPRYKQLNSCRLVLGSCEKCDTNEKEKKKKIETDKKEEKQRTKGQSLCWVIHSLIKLKLKKNRMKHTIKKICKFSFASTIHYLGYFSIFTMTHLSLFLYFFSDKLCSFFFRNLILNADGLVFCYCFIFASYLHFLSKTI